MSTLPEQTSLKLSGGLWTSVVRYSNTRSCFRTFEGVTPRGYPVT